MSCGRPVGRVLFWTAVLAATTTCTKLPYEPVQILVLEVETQGSELDEDGYIATIDDEMSQPVAANGSATFEGLGAGERLLTISGLAGNCAVDGPNPRPLSIEEDAITRASLRVICSAVGLLVVEVGTTGTTLDPDGYTVLVDDFAPRTVGTNGAVTFEGLAPGEHEVTLANIADNCGVLDEESNPRVVTVDAEASTTTTFQVQCGPRGGDLVVVAATTGTELDPDGYAIVLDEDDPTPIGTNGAITFTNLADGEHQVTINGLASNCSLAEGSRSRTVTITSNASAAETFFVFCGPPAGALIVDVATTGTDVDEDGYMVSVTDTLGQTETRPLTTNGSATFEGLAAGPYEVGLTGVAGNCAIITDETPNPRTIILTPGASSSTNFFVHCQPVAGSLVVDVSTSGIDPVPGDYSVVVDEVGAKPISANGAVVFEGLPAWGEDGPEVTYQVGIGELADGCRVDGSNTIWVRVTPRASTRASFAVVCRVPDGPPSSVTVEVITTGEDLDPDGYIVGVTGRDTTRVATNGTVTFTDLPPGEIEVRFIGDEADNCRAREPLSRVVTVLPDANVLVQFFVDCEGRVEPTGTGTLWVKARTYGEGPSDGGFRITVKEISPDTVTLFAGKSVVYRELVEGTYTVEVIGMPRNCSLVDGDPVRRALVAPGDIEVVWLWFNCR